MINFEIRGGVEYINGFALGYNSGADIIPDSGSHCTDDYEIMYLRSGERQVFVKDKAHMLSAGQLIFIERGAMHKTLSKGRGYERYVINFPREYVMPSVAERMGVLFKTAVFAPMGIKETDRLFFALHREWDRLRGRDPAAVDMIKCRLNILLDYYITNQDKFAYIGSQIDNPSVERLIKYINENFTSEITLNDAAEMLHITPSHVSRIFARYTGYGFNEYINELRIERAKELLTESNSSVKETAFACGFNDSNYFSIVFKKRVGLSPLKYKRKNL